MSVQSDFKDAKIAVQYISKKGKECALCSDTLAEKLDKQ